jgi:hypothetical protein
MTLSSVFSEALALQAREFILSILFPASVSIASNKLGNLLLEPSDSE